MAWRHALNVTIAHCYWYHIGYHFPQVSRLSLPAIQILTTIIGSMCGYSARLLHPANVGSTMKYLAEFYSAKDQRGVRDQETCDVICGQPLPIAGREEKFRNVFWWSGLFLWIVQFILTAAQGASVASVASFSRLYPLKWCETATSQ